MKKIKSRRAKECADRYICTGVHKGVHRYKYVIQAIELAEQDAEERAIKSLRFVIARQREALEKMQVSDVFKDVTKDILDFTEKGFNIMMGGQSDV